MDTTVGREADTLVFFAALADAPYRYDFYQTLRRMECLYADKPRWGEALRPADEPIRLGQDPDLSFAPAPLASFDRRPRRRRPRLQVRLFGLLGPNGPLPLHLTEYARERLRHARRSDAQPVPRPVPPSVPGAVLSGVGAGAAARQPRPPGMTIGSRAIGARSSAIVARAFRRRDAVPDVGEALSCGLVDPARRGIAEGWRPFSSTFSACPCRSRSSSATGCRWAPRERTYLARERRGSAPAPCSATACGIGQHKFRIHLGPLTLAQYESFSAAAARPHRGAGRLGAVLS